MSCNINLLLCIFFRVFIFGSAAKTGVKPKENWGPYISILNSITKCDKPTIPFATNPALVINVADIKNNVIKGNLTIIRDCGNIKYTMQDFYYEDGNLQPTFMLKDLSCRNILVSTMVDIFGLNYDKKTCAVRKGSYLFEAEYNKIDHIFMVSREYGRMLRRVQIFDKASTMACLDFHVDVRPLI